MKATLCCLALCLLAPVALAQLTPTERLNQQRQQQLQQQQQQQQQAQASAQRRVASRRLPAPCFVPTSYYPYQLCGVSTSSSECGKGYNAWATAAECCRANPRGDAIGAFVSGCTDFNRSLTCYVPSQYYPLQQCSETTDFATCSRNWSRYPSMEACCTPGRAFEEGCSAPAPCYVAATYDPERTCTATTDLSTCSRGWGAFDTEEDCCQPGKAFSDGCGLADAYEVDGSEMGPDAFNATTQGV